MVKRNRGRHAAEPTPKLSGLKLSSVSAVTAASVVALGGASLIPASVATASDIISPNLAAASLQVHAAYTTTPGVKAPKDANWYFSGEAIALSESDREQLNKADSDIEVLSADEVQALEKAREDKARAEQEKQAAAAKAAAEAKKQTAPAAPTAPTVAVKAYTAAQVAKGAGATAQEILSFARAQIGSPYVWGGTTPSGWDCIGFARYVYGHFGIHLPTSSWEAQYAGHQIPASQARPGDLMWWPGHVAIYVGGNKNIAAWNPQMGTRIGNNYGTPRFLRVFDNK